MAEIKIQVSVTREALEKVFKTPLLSSDPNYVKDARQRLDNWLRFKEEVLDPMFAEFRKLDLTQFDRVTSAGHMILELALVVPGSQ